MPKTVRKRTMVELKQAIYDDRGWTRKAGESMSERIKPLYDVRLDHQRGEIVATPKPVVAREGDEMSEKAKPTATKDRGSEWYYPAVRTVFGPKRLPHGDRQETRAKAVAEAKRLIAEAANDMIDQTIGRDLK